MVCDRSDFTANRERRHGVLQTCVTRRKGTKAGLSNYSWADEERAGGQLMLPEVVRTLRLILRPWSLVDVSDVFAYAADEEWGRYLPTPHPYCEADAHQFVASQVSLDRRAHFAWAIEHARRAIGGVDLRLFEEGRIAEIDFAVARALWGRGFATEAVTGVVEAAFRGLPSLMRIRSMIDARNAASSRVLENVGMKREGLLRSNSFARGEAVDEVWYGVLRSDRRATSSDTGRSRH